MLSHNMIWLRRKHGLSKKQMAKRLGIGIGTLNALERGELPPRMGVSVLYAIHDSLGTAPSLLLTQWLED